MKDELCFASLKDWMPSYADGFSKGQQEALDFMLRTIGQMQPGIHVLNTPCGCGKTTAISALIGWCATAKDKPISAIILTNRRQRLKDYLDAEDLREKIEDATFCRKHGFRTDRAYSYMVLNLSDEGEGGTPLAAALSTPIILMTLQKWNLMDQRTRDDLIYYTGPDGKKEKRDMMVIDEEITACEVVEVTNKMINALRGTLIDRIRDPEEKDTAARIYSQFIQWIETQQDRMLAGKDDVTLPFIPERMQFADTKKDEARFQMILKKNRDDLCKCDLELVKRLEAIRNLIRPDACTIFRGGQNEGKGYRYFLTRVDHHAKIDDSIPVYILDGTADQSLAYKGWARAHDCTGSTRDMSNVSILVRPARTNTTACEDGVYRSLLFQTIYKAVGTCGEDCLVTGYKKYKRHLMDALETENVGTYGDLTGHNQWRGCTRLVKTGLLRKQRMISFMEATYYYPAIWEHFRELMKDKSQWEQACAKLNAISADSTDLFRGEIEETVISQWMVDTIQEIYRLKLRDYHAQDSIFIQMFFHVDPTLGDSIYTRFFLRLQAYFGCYGASVKVGEGSAVLEGYRAESRKSTKGTGEKGAYGKIMDALRELLAKEGEGALFTQDSLAQKAGISLQLLRTTIARKKRLGNMLSEMRCAKNGKTYVYRLHAFE